MSHRLLVVDDEKDIADPLARILSREGYQVSVAYDGEEALSRVKDNDPDVILLDLMLPKLNGFEVLQQIREKHNQRWRPVIIISAQQDLDTARKCYNMEADQYLTKPCSTENILRGLKTLISLIPQRDKI